jgi:hypothetical protein
MEQAKGTLHAFVAAASTGGTIAGVSQYLKVCMLFNLFILYNLLSDKHFLYYDTLYLGKEQKHQMLFDGLA